MTTPTTVYDPHVHAWALNYTAQHGNQALATATGKYDRAAISLYVRQKYPANPGRIEDALRPLMDARYCAFLERDLTPDDCASRAALKRPQQKGSYREEHWQACQACKYQGQQLKNTGDKS